MVSVFRSVALGTAALLAFMWSAAPTSAQTVEWLRQLGSSDRDYGEDISLDGVGGLYVSGRGGWEGSGSGSDFSYEATLSKFDLSGNVLWSRLLKPVTARSIVNAFPVSADPLGNVYISGGTDVGIAPAISDAFLRKYSANGDLIWTRQFGTSEVDNSEGVQADGLGNVYVSGSTLGSLYGPNAGRSDAFLSKYDANGALLWSRQYGTKDNEDTVTLAADGLGNVYISGHVVSYDEFQSDLSGTFLAKYDSFGEPIWSTQYFGGVGSTTSYAVAADSLGNIYQAGQKTINGAVNGFLNRYDSEGILIWSRQLGLTTAGTYFYEVAVDGLGNALVTGRTFSSLEGTNSGGSDAFVAKYSNAGALDYIWQFGTERNDIASGIAVDQLGILYVAGATSGDFGGPNAGNYDVFLLKRSSAPVTELSGDYDLDSDVDGADFLLWQRSLGSTTNLAADGDGNGSVGAEDYAIWCDHFGQGGNAGAVPEPSSLLLAGMAILPLFRRASLLVSF